MNTKRAPKVRFKGFTDAWEQRKFESIATRASSISADPTLPQVEYEDIISGIGLLNKDVKLKESSKQGIVFNQGDVLYGKLRPYLHNWLLPTFSGLAVGDFWVLQPKDADSSFLFRLIQGQQFDDVANQSTGTKMPRADWNLVSKTLFFIPTSIDEQALIGRYFRSIDNLIALHQRKLDRMKELKKAFLDLIFSQKLRFEGFTDSWELRKFSDLVLIERGGSPRPIDNFITEDPNGLNWVKIGDAPEQGNYITKTAEKIKPEGLSKTRQVQPGDLILSNSMSFGKPYIIAINGCIHDGWLLIRDTQKRFDLKFLCYLLGTPQILEQYKSFAAGSTVNNLNKELVGNTLVTIPTKEEQCALGRYFEHMDHLITLHQKKIDSLKEMKKILLKNMLI
ncbi:restriction endonuclease subunit S [Phascolarctobacterium faecium]|uniref:restriction endonuclease subunit S n=1 Tax=Phascolarctobacterium faecium TaxID=33025 RepID=UPI0026650E0C|nr:restriction endonuclease subunit S [Phascolarctobacterium faecium]